MSLYSDISKKIGWQGTATIPTVSEARKILERVELCDIDAFEQAFRICRFVPGHHRPDQDAVEAMRIIIKAYETGRRQFA